MCFDDGIFENMRYCCCRKAIAEAPRVDYSRNEPLKDFVKKLFGDNSGNKKSKSNFLENLKSARQSQQCWNDTSIFERYKKTLLWYTLGIIYTIIFAIPLYTLLITVYVISCFKNIITLYFCHLSNPTLQTISQCKFIKKSSTYDSIIFSLFRVPLYNYTMTFNLFWNLARSHAGAFKIPVMSDEELFATLLTTAVGRDMDLVYRTKYGFEKITTTQFGKEKPPVNVNLKKYKGILPYYRLNSQIKNKVKTVGSKIKHQIFGMENSNQSNVDEEKQNEKKVNHDDNDSNNDNDNNNDNNNNNNNKNENNNNNDNDDDDDDSKTLCGMRVDFAVNPRPSAQELELFPNFYLRTIEVEMFDDKTYGYTASILLQNPNATSTQRDSNDQVNDKGEPPGTIRIFKPNPGEKDENKLRQWNVAKAHLQSMLCWYSPAWSHNFVHFHLLDIVAARSPVSVAPKTVLGVILKANLKFTSFINTVGTADGLTNPQSAYNFIRKILPWKQQPVTPQQFAQTIAQNTVYHYLWLTNTDDVAYVRQSFPPSWVTLRDSKDPKSSIYRGAVPYLDYLADYYFAIRKFISKLWLPIEENENENEIENEHETGDTSAIFVGKRTLLEHDIFMQWRMDLETNGFPGLGNFDGIDILTTIIWTSSVVHGSDHITYSNIFQNWPMYAAPVDFNPNGDWRDVVQNQYQAFRSRVFVDVFTAYHYSAFKGITQDMLTSPHLYDNWESVPQKWKVPKLQKIHKEFLNDLKELNLKWGWLMDIKAIPASTCF